MITAIRKKLSLPLIVGGGIDTVQKAEEAYKAGADMIVISSVLEEQPEMVSDFSRLRDELNR